MPKKINLLVDENETIGPDGSKSHGPNSVLACTVIIVAGKTKIALLWHIYSGEQLWA